MKKDSIYYETRIIKRCQAHHRRMTNGKTTDEIFEMLRELEITSSDAILSRIGVHLHEAFTIIRALLGDTGPTDPDKIYHIEWIDRMSAISKDAKGDLLQQDWTRAQMLDRLHWIASEEFGEDLEEWKSWMAAFEENPPAWGGR